ncbi:MAG: exosortase N [Bacteroidota bacterium]
MHKFAPPVIFSFTHSLRLLWKNRLAIGTVALFGAYLLTGWFLLNEYFGNHPVLFAGLLFTPYVLVVRKPGQFSYRYGWLALILLAATIWMPIKTLYFLAIAFAGLFWVESRIGKINYLPVFFFGVMSPVFNFLTTIFGFPIRLQLSEWAGAILQMTGVKTGVSGNIITVNGTGFSVDPACVGLNMLVVSLLISLLLLAYHERKSQRTLPFYGVVFALVGTFGLNIIGNLIRIVLLVQFRILPENPLHEVVGMACLIGYIVLPLTWLTPFLFNYPLPVWKPVWSIRSLYPWATGLRWSRFTWIHAVLLLLVVGRGWVWEGRGGNEFAEPHAVPGYNREVLQGSVYKFSKKDVLLYVKPVAEFYDAEHTPLICWRGSGYEFKQIGRNTCAGQDIYTGVLEKGSDKIYTAWWFDNGQHRTISQSDWRWRMSRGEAAFSLVNVNCSNEQALLEEVNSLMKKDLF